MMIMTAGGVALFIYFFGEYKQSKNDPGLIKNISENPQINYENKRMEIKVMYRTKLRMSKEKVAAQVAHVILTLHVEKHLGKTPVYCDIVVLKVSDKKFFHFLEQKDCALWCDKGDTKVNKNIPTAIAWTENKLGG